MTLIQDRPARRQIDAILSRSTWLISAFAGGGTGGNSVENVASGSSIGRRARQRRRGLIRMSRTQHGRLIERPANDLHRQRQAIRCEADALRDRRSTQHVEWRRQRGAAPEIDRLVRIKPRRRSRAQCQQQIVSLVNRLPFPRSSPAARAMPARNRCRKTTKPQ